MNYWIDSHAHVYLQDFDQDRDEMMHRCHAQGVEKIYMPHIDATSTDAMMEVEMKYPGRCIAMMGLHPCSVKKNFEKELYHIEGWLAKRGFAAIGEIGTDLYWDKTFWEQQKEAFLIQVRWARKYRLPVVVHCRESLEETIAMLEAVGDENLKGVFHCFNGTLEEARRIIKLGFYLGIGGVSTFKNGGLDKVVPELGLGNIVLETDSPYLSPVPHRGKRNEPAYIPLIAQRLADLKKTSLLVLQQATSANANALFQV